MSSHLLSLATLHAAAPGVLDVIFGPDGDFDGAPPWRCPIWDASDGRGGDWTAISRLARAPYAERFMLDNWLFDVRVPTVAARLAVLCARAFGLRPVHSSGEWYWVARGDYAEFGRYGQIVVWHRRDATLTPVGLRPGQEAPSLPATASDSDEAFLAALTLALAPRIAQEKT